MIMAMALSLLCEGNLKYDIPRVVFLNPSNQTETLIISRTQRLFWCPSETSLEYNKFPVYNWCWSFTIDRAGVGPIEHLGEYTPSPVSSHVDVACVRHHDPPGGTAFLFGNVLPWCACRRLPLLSTRGELLTVTWNHWVTPTVDLNTFIVRGRHNLCGQIRVSR